MNKRRPLAMIAAMDENRVIGNGDEIPWHHPEDLKFFKRMTLGHALIMGRATFETLGKPLPRRHTIILTRNEDYEVPGCQVAHSLEDALEMAYTLDPEPFIAGGGKIYELAMPHATLLYLTLIPGEHEGDAHFPEFDESAFEEIEQRTSEAGLTYRTLRRTAG